MNSNTNNSIISVIVPVYNVESYVRKTIDSVLNQTFQNFELILVDDGSTDNSGIICDEYTLKDKRIKVIHQKNAGQSAARNNGFEIARGEYICFLDSDDWFSENALEVFINTIKNYDVEIVMIKLLETYSENIEYKAKDNIKLLTSNDCINSLLNDQYYLNSPCNKIYKRELIQKLKFPEGMIYEDFYIIIDRFIQIKQLAYTEKACLFYRIRNTSTTHSCFSKKNLQFIDSLEHVNNRALEINRKDLWYFYSNQLLGFYMEYSLKLSDSDIPNKAYYIKKYRIKSKKLFKSLPFYKWKLNLIKRFFIFIISFKIFKLYYKNIKNLFKTQNQ